MLPCALPWGAGEESKKTQATKVSTQKDVWSSCMASPAFKMPNPNLGRKQVPILFRRDTRVLSQCPVLFIHFSLLLLPVFPLSVLTKPVGPWHTPSTVTLQITQEQLLLGQQHTGVWIQLWCPSEGEARLPKQGLLLLWPQIFLAIKETGFFLLKKKKNWKN